MGLQCRSCLITYECVHGCARRVAQPVNRELTITWCVNFTGSQDYMDCRWYWLNGSISSYTVVLCNYIYLSFYLLVNLLSSVAVYHSKSCQYCALISQPRYLLQRGRSTCTPFILISLKQPLGLFNSNLDFQMDAAFQSRCGARERSFFFKKNMADLRHFRMPK